MHIQYFQNFIKYKIWDKCNSLLDRSKQINAYLKDASPKSLTSKFSKENF